MDRMTAVLTFLFEASWVWFRFFYGPVLMGSVR